MVPSDPVPCSASMQRDRASDIKDLREPIDVAASSPLAWNRSVTAALPKTQGYVLGPWISDIGSSVLSANTPAGFAQPLLERLVAETRRAVVASIGVRPPAHPTVAGRAMLAALSEAQLRALYPSVGALVTHAGPRPGPGNCECVRGTKPAHPRQDLIEWPSISCSNSS